MLLCFLPGGLQLFFATVFVQGLADRVRAAVQLVEQFDDPFSHADLEQVDAEVHGAGKQRQIQADAAQY